METRANYTAVGAFVLIVILGLFVAGLWLARLQFSQEYAFYQTNVAGPVTGLNSGAMVRLNGIEVGRVTIIEQDPNDPRRVVITMQVRPGLKIHEDSVASLETQGLTGLSYVEVDGGTQAAPLLAAVDDQRYPMIKSKPSVLQSVFANTPEVLARLVVITDRLALLLDDQNRAAIADTLTNLRDSSAVLARHSRDLDSILGDGAKTFHSLAQSAESLETMLGGLDGKLGAVSQRVDQVLASANDATRKFGSLAGDLDGVVEGSRGQIKDFAAVGLGQFSQLISEARTLVTSLTRVSNELERDPTRFLFGDRRQGFAPR